MNHATANRSRRTLFGGFSALAAVLAMASVAWACTANPFVGVPVLEGVYDAAHCEVHNPGDPDCLDELSAPVIFVAHGSGTLYNGVVVDVYQDNDDTTAVADGKFMSAVGGCDGGDPVRGTVTYGRQTVGNFRIGTGSGVLRATDGPGLYGICAGPPAQLSALGQFIFM